VIVVIVVIAGLYAVFRSSSQTSASGTTPRADYQVGTPGPGQILK
jgi:hypothetical protein